LGKRPEKRQRPSPTGRIQRDFFAGLYRQAAYRWIALFGGLALLIWLAAFAGRVRTEGGVKRSWAVVASRVLVVACGVFLVRLLLFPYEERVPVLLVDMIGAPPGTASTDRALEWIRSKHDAGMEIVPLDDVVSFIAERRYVPGRCVALVVLTPGNTQSKKALERLEGISHTILLSGHEEWDRPGGAPKSRYAFDAHVGIDIPAGEDLKATMNEFADQAMKLWGKQPVCARAQDYRGVDLNKIARETGYLCVLGAAGLNRFGEDPQIVSPIDVAPIFRQRRLSGLSMSVHLGLYRGGHIWWPVVGILRAFGAAPVYT
jgi:hypothetical protein